MNAWGHVIVGGTCAVAVASVVDVTVSSTALMSTLVGSLLLDIDHPKSTLGRYNPLVGLMKHRGHTHSIIGAIILGLPFLGISKEACLFAIVGTLSHIAADKLYSWFPGHSRFRIKIW